MKYSSLLLILFLSITVAQAQTIVPKTIIIAKISAGVHPVELHKDVIGGRMVYSLIFQNRQYSELADIKTWMTDTAGLREMIKGLSAAQIASNGESVLMDHFSISKTKTFFTSGATLYQLHYDGGYCNLSEKDVRKLMEAIKKEL